MIFLFILSILKTPIKQIMNQMFNVLSFLYRFSQDPYGDFVNNRGLFEEFQRFCTSERRHLIENSIRNEVGFGNFARLHRMIVSIDIMLEDIDEPALFARESGCFNRDFFEFMFNLGTNEFNQNFADFLAEYSEILENQTNPAPTPVVQ